MYMYSGLVNETMSDYFSLEGGVKQQQEQQRLSPRGGPRRGDPPITTSHAPQLYVVGKNTPDSATLALHA